MGKTLKQLFEDIPAELSSAERANMRQMLAEHIGAPVRKKIPERHILWSNLFVFRLLNERKISMPAIILILVMTLSGGTAFAAQGSAPGDILYPVKINVNEKVRTALAVNTEAKAELGIDMAEDRLEETEKLAAKNELKAEVRDRLADNFARHAEAVKERIAEMTEKNPEAASKLQSRFEVSLSAHEQILSRLGIAATSTSAIEAKKIIEVIRGKQQGSGETRTNIEKRVNAQTEIRLKAAAEGKLKAAELKIAEVQKFIDRNKAVLGATAVAEAQTKLDVASRIIAEGKVKLEAGAGGVAFALFQRAHNTASEAQLLVHARAELKIEIRAKARLDQEVKVDLR